MRWVHASVTVLIAICGMSCSAPDEAASLPAFIYTNLAPDQSDKQWQIYEDDTIKMVGVGYGDATWQSKPGLFVFRKATADWIKIEKVSTRGPTFGRSPTFQEVKDAATTTPSIGWDFRNLAEQVYVDLPLTSAGVLFFPDKVELNNENREYVLHFSSAWQIKGVATVLRLPLDAVNAREMAEQ